MKSKWLLFAIGWIIVVAGSLLAYFTETANGVRIQDVRFTGSNGVAMSALLYIPPNATKASPAPGILAVHGYINSRETQSGFAIEFARRGYVVLALDQTGHGYSGAPVFSNGFGGPDGLKYLRGLDIVDPANIGLEGHSMGGWTVLQAAAKYPDGYKAIVLEGSSTGSGVAPEGSPQFPHNLGLVFSQYDEFSVMMWEVDRAATVTQKSEAVEGVRHGQANCCRTALRLDCRRLGPDALHARRHPPVGPYVQRGDRRQSRLVRPHAARRDAVAGG